MPDDLKTNKTLLDALKQASGRTQTSEEVESQRVSFVMGSLKSRNAVTRARVQEILAQQEGKKA